VLSSLLNRLLPSPQVLSICLWKSLSENNHLGATLIVRCTRCGGLLMAAEGQKTRTCPYCGARVQLTKTNVIASAENAFLASEILKEIKSKKNVHDN